MAPAIRLEKRRRVLRPLDPEDPVVAEGEPGGQKRGQSEGGGLGAVGGGVGAPQVGAAGVQLVPEHPCHFYGTDAAAYDHVDGDVGLPGAIADELDACELEVKDDKLG